MSERALAMAGEGREKPHPNKKEYVGTVQWSGPADGVTSYLQAASSRILCCSRKIQMKFAYRQLSLGRGSLGDQWCSLRDASDAGSMSERGRHKGAYKAQKYKVGEEA
jgi:hypothetical protein